MTITAGFQQGLASLVDAVRAFLAAGTRGHSYGERLAQSKAQHEKLLKDWAGEALDGEEKNEPSPPSGF